MSEGSEKSAESTLARLSGLVGQLERWGLLVAFAVTIGFFSLVRPEVFPTFDNARTILESAAIPAIIAVGLTIPLSMNDFDLSIGATVGLSLGVTIMMMTGGSSWWIAGLVGVVVGALCGLGNGLLVAGLGLHSFITTLASASVIAGLEAQQTGQVTIFQGIPKGFTDFGDLDVMSFRIDVWIAVAVTLAAWLVIRFTEPGRFVAAIGGSSEAAWLAGIPVKRYRIVGFVIAGAMSALAGVLIGAKSGSYYPNPGTGFLLPSFAAAFLGTALFSGREFKIIGTIVGVLYLGIIRTGLTQLDVDTWIVNVVQGTVLVGALLLSRVSSSRK